MQRAACQSCWRTDKWFQHSLLPDNFWDLALIVLNNVVNNIFTDHLLLQKLSDRFNDSCSGVVLCLATPAKKLLSIQQALSYMFPAFWPYLFPRLLFHSSQLLTSSKVRHYLLPNFGRISSRRSFFLRILQLVVQMHLSWEFWSAIWRDGVTVSINLLIFHLFPVMNSLTSVLPGLGDKRTK